MMRIHSLVIDNVRGIDHLELSGLPETGVVVIHGDNEVGKSTLAEAIDVVLNEKHGGRSRKIQALQPVGKDVAPQITLEATVGPVHFRITKRWLRKKASELQVLGPHPAQFTGGQADDELERILGAHLDRALLQALFLRQDDLGEGISAVGIPSVTTALEKSSGVAEEVVNAEDSELMTKVEAEFLKYFSARQARPAHAYKEAIDTLARAEEKAEAAQEKLASLEGVVESYEKILEDKKAAEGSLPLAKQERAEAGVALEKAQQAAEKAAAQRERVHLAAAEVERLKLLEVQRGELKAGVEAAVKDLQRTAKELDAAREKASSEAVAKAELEEQLESAQAAWSAVREQLKLARRLQAKQECSDLEARIAKLEELDTSLKRAREALRAARDIKEADIKELRSAAQEVAVAQRVHAATAPKLRLSAAPVTEVRVDENTLAVGEETVVKLAEGTRLEIGAVTAIFEAGAGSQEESGAVVARAGLRLKEAQDLIGCDTVEEAEALREVYRALREELNRAEREWQLELGEDEVAELEERHRQLVEEVAELPAEDIDLRTAEEEEEAARELVEAKEKALAPYRDSATVQEVIRWETLHDTARSEVERTRTKLETAREATADADVRASVLQAEGVLEQRKAELAQMQEVDLDTARALVEGAQSRLQGLEDTVRQAELDLSELSSHIQVQTGAAEEAAQATAQLDNAREAHAAIERRAMAVRYLRELLLKHRDAARERYAQPFTQQLSEFARTVFGKGVSFELNEELQIQARTRENQTVPVESLSGGAREQLAILTRFAIAKLVDADGVPVIVDDALGSTDVHRLQLMSTLFSSVGQYAQVLVLTCVPERYSRVPGRKEYRFSDLRG
ncbi:AAA family ATPase [Corynebacterium flavescens]